MKILGGESATSSLWGAKDVAHYLGVSERTAVRYMRDGKIRSGQIGGRWRTTEPLTKEFVNELFSRVDRNSEEIAALKREIQMLRETVRQTDQSSLA